MHCRSWEWTIVRLVVSENEGRRHDNEMGITGQKEQGLRPNSWAECRKKIDIEPKGSCFFLTFLFIGPFWFPDLPSIFGPVRPSYDQNPGQTRLQYL